MSLFSKLLLVISLLLISHSGFSSYEFHQLLKRGTAQSPSGVSSQIPRDIVYENLIGVALFVLSAFFSFEKLSYYPLLGPKIALTQGQYLEDIGMDKATNVDNLIGNDPSGAINHTPSFVDVIAKREQTRQWASKKDL